MISGLSDAPSQKALQNLLSPLRRQTQAGCAHLSSIWLAISETSVPI
jgi:hypothetical protein